MKEFPIFEGKRNPNFVRMKKLKDILTLILLSSLSICIILITNQLLTGVNVNISHFECDGPIELDGNIGIGSKFILDEEEEIMLDAGFKYQPLIIK